MKLGGSSADDEGRDGFAALGCGKIWAAQLDTVR